MAYIKDRHPLGCLSFMYAILGSSAILCDQIRMNYELHCYKEMMNTEIVAELSRKSEKREGT